jgi:hypothetical protein
MPPKRHAKAWRELLKGLQEKAIVLKERNQQIKRQRVREIRQEIDRLEAKGPNPGRAKQVRLLRLQLSKH